MKKIFLTIAFIASGLVASAQVGVGTTDPQVSLQVDRSDVATDADGVLVPRVTVAQLNDKAAAYVAAQNGALVFITDITGFAGKTSNVTAAGFHYYNSTTEKWVAVGGGQVAVPYQNIGGSVQDAVAGDTVLNTAYLVKYTGIAGALNTPTAVEGKTFHVRNNGTGAITIASVIVGVGKGRTFISDGTSWIMMTP